MSDEIKDFFAFERKLVWDLPPNARLVLLEAIHRARYNGNRVDPAGDEMQMGQFYFGRKELAKRCGCTEKQIRTALKHLEKCGLLKHIKGTTKGTSAFIGKMGWIMAIKGPTEGQQRATNIPVPVPVPKELEQARQKPRDTPFLEETAFVFSELVRITGKKFRPVETNFAYIRDLLRTGVSASELIDVIRLQTQRWKDSPKMAKFIRPETLFGRKKFESYYADAVTARETEALLDAALGPEAAK